MSSSVIHRLCRLAAAAALALMAASCGSSDTFIVDGRIDRGSGSDVELTYYSDGAVRRITSSAGADGKFRIEGRSSQPALAFLTVAGGAPAAVLVVADGEHTELTVKPRTLAGAPAAWTAKGSRTNATLARFAADNADLIASGSPEAINKAVADYVTAHPADVASAALLVTNYVTRGYETRADSLMGMLDVAARRPGVVHNFMASMASQLSSEAHESVRPMALFHIADSTVRYTPARHSVSLLAFVGTDRAMLDSVAPRLREAADRWPLRRCGVIEVSLAPDSASWRASASAVKDATWTRAWAPGTVAAPAFRRLAVRRAPFFIVADSTGRQLYRGGSVSEAYAEVSRQLSNR